MEVATRTRNGVKWHLPVRKNSIFGRYLDVPMPEGCSVLIVCIREYGLIPKTLCLPHQVYCRTLRRLLRENPRADNITLIPARHEDYIEAAST